jgi:hypothetical protein
VKNLSDRRKMRNNSNYIKMAIQYLIAATCLPIADPVLANNFVLLCLPALKALISANCKP